MYRKRCPFCAGVSYSAAEMETWLCPYCGKDITFVPATWDEEEEEG